MNQVKLIFLIMMLLSSSIVIAEQIDSVSIANNDDLSRDILPIEPLIRVAGLYAKQRNGIDIIGSEEILNQNFTASFKSLMQAELERSKDEVGLISFDILYHAQDFAVTEFAIKMGQVTDDEAEVIAEGINVSEPFHVIFILKNVNNQWLVDNIKYPENKDDQINDLRRLLQFDE